MIPKVALQKILSDEISLTEKNEIIYTVLLDYRKLERIDLFRAFVNLIIINAEDLHPSIIKSTWVSCNSFDACKDKLPELDKYLE